MCEEVHEVEPYIGKLFATERTPSNSIMIMPLYRGLEQGDTGVEEGWKNLAKDNTLLQRRWKTNEG